MNESQESKQQSKVHTTRDIDKEIRILHKKLKNPLETHILLLLLSWFFSLVTLALLSVLLTSVQITGWGAPLLLTLFVYSMAGASWSLRTKRRIVSLKEEKKRLIEEEKREKELLKRDMEILKKHFETEQKAKGLIKYKDRWGTPPQVKKWKEIDTGLSNNFANLSPYQFEDFIAQLFRKMGYHTQGTPRSGDFGADIIARKDGEKILIEVKKYAHGHNITPKQVQRTLGAIWKHKADKAVFVTTSGFTVRAKEIERGAPIELWDKRILHQMVRKYFIEADK